MRILIVLAALVALAGCSSTGTVTPPDRPRLDPPAASSLVACRLPVDLPPGEMTQRDIERYWGTDRKQQVICAKRHAALRDYIIDRDSGLTGKTK